MLLTGEVRWCLLVTLVFLAFVSCDPSKAQGRGKNLFLVILCLFLTILISTISPYPVIQLFHIMFSRSPHFTCFPPTKLHLIDPLHLCIMLPPFYCFFSSVLTTTSLSLSYISSSPWEHGTSCKSNILFIEFIVTAHLMLTIFSVFISHCKCAAQRITFLCALIKIGLTYIIAVSQFFLCEVFKSADVKKPVALFDSLFLSIWRRFVKIFLEILPQLCLGCLKLGCYTFLISKFNSVFPEMDGLMVLYK